MEHQHSIVKTILYLESKQRVIPLPVKVAAQRAMKQAGGYNGTRATYWAAVYDAVNDYLTGDSSRVTAFKSSMKKAMVEAFTPAAEAGYESGGGTLPMDKDTEEWLTSRQAAELGFIDVLFSDLKALKKQGDFDPITESFARANGYAGTLDTIFSGAKLRGAGNKILTWRFGDTVEHCDTCSSLDGKRHRANWFTARNYIPGGVGSSLDCGGFNCDCSLEDDNGEVFAYRGQVIT